MTRGGRWPFGSAPSLALAILLASTMALFFDPRPALALRPSPLYTTLPGAVAEAAEAAAVDAAVTAGAGAAVTGGAAVVAGGAAILGAVCLFTSVECSIPNWHQNPKVPPNGDQPTNPKGAISPLTWTGQNGSTSYTNGCDPSGVLCFALTSPTPGTLRMTMTVGRDRFPNYSVSVGPSCQTIGGANYPASTDFAGSAPIRVMIKNAGCSGDFQLVTSPSSVTVGTGQPDDPLRTTQGRRTCGNRSGGQTTVYGPPVSYRESETTRAPITVPACPESFPVPLSAGSVRPLSTGGNPVNVPQPQPDPGDQPVLVPVPFPNTFPMCPDALSCTVQPTPAGATPVLGPAPYADPTNTTSGCMWGPYGIPASECDAVGQTPMPPKPPTTAPSPAPTNLYPSPNPTDQPCDPWDYLPGGDCNPDGHNDHTPQAHSTCLNADDPASWVDRVDLGVRCALRWAFVPGDGTQERLAHLGDDLGNRVPFGYVAAIRAGATSASEAAGSGCMHGPQMDVSGFRMAPLDLCPGSDLRNALQPLRGALSAGLWLSMLVPFGMWLFRASVPVVGGGESS